MVAHGAVLSPMAHANVTPPLKRGQPPSPILRLYCDRSVALSRACARAFMRACACTYK